MKTRVDHLKFEIEFKKRYLINNLYALDVLHHLMNQSTQIKNIQAYLMCIENALYQNGCIHILRYL